MNSCPKCGSSINQGETFCRVCGAKIVTPENNFNNTQQVNNQNVNAAFESNPNQAYQQPGYNPNQAYQQHGYNPNQAYQQPVNNVQPGYNPNPAYQQPVNNGYQQPNNYGSDEELVDAYIGKNADKLKNGGFSANTFLFGFIYVL